MHSRKNYEFFGHEIKMQPMVGFEPNTMQLLIFPSMVIRSGCLFLSSNFFFRFLTTVNCQVFNNGLYMHELRKGSV